MLTPQIEQVLNRLDELDIDIAEILKNELFKNSSQTAKESWARWCITGYSSIVRITGGSPLGEGAPTNAYPYGLLITINNVHAKTAQYTTVQIYIPDSACNNGIYTRSATNAYWLKSAGTSVNAVS